MVILQVWFKKSFTYWFAFISLRTCSSDSRKNRSSSVLWSKIFLAKRLTLFISLVLRSITRCSLASSIFAASFSVLACITIVFFSVLNSLDIWLSDFSKVWIFSVNCEIRVTFIDIEQWIVSPAGQAVNILSKYALLQLRNIRPHWQLSE